MTSEQWPRNHSEALGEIASLRQQLADEREAHQAALTIPNNLLMSEQRESELLRGQLAAARRENEAMREIVDAARLMPRETPAAGGCTTMHAFEIEAANVWAMDRALTQFDRLTNEQSLTANVGRE
jgi:hypothetical protein